MYFSSLERNGTARAPAKKSVPGPLVVGAAFALGLGVAIVAALAITRRKVSSAPAALAKQ